jgi:hypothetical protein
VFAAAAGTTKREMYLIPGFLFRGRHGRSEEVVRSRWDGGGSKLFMPLFFIVLQISVVHMFHSLHLFFSYPHLYYVSSPDNGVKLM